jgi:hypothetical protein
MCPRGRRIDRCTIHSLNTRLNWCWRVHRDMLAPTMKPPAVLLCIALFAGCAKPAVSSLPVPNPNGCYVMVFDQPEFLGVRDIWNGPGRWSTLEGLKRTRPTGWRNQVRSMQVGPNATVAVFTEMGFRGLSMELTAGSDYPELDKAMSEGIEAVQVTCR